MEVMRGGMVLNSSHYNNQTGLRASRGKGRPVEVSFFDRPVGGEAMRGKKTVGTKNVVPQKLRTKQRVKTSWQDTVASKVIQGKNMSYRKHAGVKHITLIQLSFQLSVTAATTRLVRCSSQVRAATIGRQLPMVLTARTACTSSAVI